MDLSLLQLTPAECKTCVRRRKFLISWGICQSRAPHGTHGLGGQQLSCRSVSQCSLKEGTWEVTFRLAAASCSCLSSGLWPGCPVELVSKETAQPSPHEGNSAGNRQAPGEVQTRRWLQALNLPFGAQLAVTYLLQHSPGGAACHRDDVAAWVGLDLLNVLWYHAPTTAIALQAQESDSEQGANPHGFVSYSSPSETRQPAGHLPNAKLDTLELSSSFELIPFSSICGARLNSSCQTRRGD